MQSSPKKLVSVVTACFNEEENVRELAGRVVVAAANAVMRELR